MTAMVHHLYLLISKTGRQYNWTPNKVQPYPYWQTPPCYRVGFFILKLITYVMLFLWTTDTNHLGTVQVWAFSIVVGPLLSFLMLNYCLRIVYISPSYRQLLNWHRQLLALCVLNYQGVPLLLCYKDIAVSFISSVSLSDAWLHQVRQDKCIEDLPC